MNTIKVILGILFATSVAKPMTTYHYWAEQNDEKGTVTFCFPDYAGTKNVRIGLAILRLNLMGNQLMTEAATELEVAMVYAQSEVLCVAFRKRKGSAITLKRLTELMLKDMNNDPQHFVEISPPKPPSQPGKRSDVSLPALFFY